MIGRLIQALSRCVVCDDPAPGQSICTRCAHDLPRLRWLCPRCALPRRTPHAPCGTCLIHTPDWHAAACAFAYRFPCDYLLKRAKFRGRAPELDALATCTAQHFAQWPAPPVDVVIPVPLHWRRHWRRGFNQAEELARPVARALGLNLDPTLVRRRRATREQSGLHTDDRLANLQHAFACTTPLEGKRVLLFDDVMTTGATLGAVTGALLDAGASHVRVWACARAVPK